MIGNKEGEKEGGKQPKKQERGWGWEVGKKVDHIFSPNPHHKLETKAQLEKQLTLQEEKCWRGRGEGQGTRDKKERGEKKKMEIWENNRPILQRGGQPGEKTSNERLKRKEREALYVCQKRSQMEQNLVRGRGVS